MNCNMVDIMYDYPVTATLRKSTCDRVWLPLIIIDWSLSGFRDERKGGA